LLSSNNTVAGAPSAACIAYTHRDVTRLVDEAVAAVVKPPNNRIYTEVLKHLHTCQTFASDFEGREEVLLLPDQRIRP